MGQVRIFKRGVLYEYSIELVLDQLGMISHDKVLAYNRSYHLELERQEKEFFERFLKEVPNPTEDETRERTERTRKTRRIRDASSFKRAWR